MTTAPSAISSDELSRSNRAARTANAIVVCRKSAQRFGVSVELTTIRDISRNLEKSTNIAPVIFELFSYVEEFTCARGSKSDPFDQADLFRLPAPIWRGGPTLKSPGPDVCMLPNGFALESGHMLWPHDDIDGLIPTKRVLRLHESWVQ